MPVYIIQCGEQPFVKIGKADNPDKRRHTLQASHYEPLHIIRVVPGGLHTEMQFRERFRRHHVRREWYHLHEDMMTFQPEPDPDPDLLAIAREIEESGRRLRYIRVRC